MFGEDERVLSPWHTTKRNGRRYRYYIPQRDAKEYAGASKLPRLPAAELEAAVLQQLRANGIGQMVKEIKPSKVTEEALA